MSDKKPVWLLDVDGVINIIDHRGYWDRDELRHGWAVSDDDGITWPITWAPEVVDFIIRVDRLGAAEVRWHTTWQHHAWAISQLCGLPEFAVHPAPEFYDRPSFIAAAVRDGQPRWWKYPGALRVVIEEKRPLVWTDDDLSYEVDDSHEDLFWRYAQTLFVSPDTRTGLTRKNLAAIARFLELDGLE